jgi:hypothetical protein
VRKFYDGLLSRKGIGNWSLTSLQRRLVKTGGRLVKHARYYRLLLAESHLTRGHAAEDRGAAGTGGIVADVRLPGKTMRCSNCGSENPAGRKSLVSNIDRT